MFIHHKQGLVRGFIVIVFGVLFLSYLGFDLREKVDEFQKENKEEISTVKQWLFSVILPGAEDVYQEVSGYAESNGVTIESVMETIQKLLQNAGEVNIPTPDVNPANSTDS